jgi:hypothetical protein
LPAIEDAVAATQDELTGYLVSQPDAGCEISGIGINQSAGAGVANSKLGAERRRQLRVLSLGSEQ